MNALLILTIVIGIIWFVPILCRKIHVPSIVGFILAFAIVFIIELSDKRIKSHDDIADKYDYYMAHFEEVEELLKKGVFI